MLAATPFHFQFDWAPSRPSPLSERSANVASRPFSLNFSMSGSMQDENAKEKHFHRRAHKPNPLVQSRDAATRQRRDMFFRRVQKDRDDKQWDARGEQIQRSDYLNDHKRWEAEKLREASELDLSLVEESDTVTDDTMLPESSPAPPSRSDVEAEYLAAQEERELQELIASLEDEPENSLQHFGSDDEDYDAIFMECVVESDAQRDDAARHDQVPANTQVADDDAMDMS